MSSTSSAIRNARHIKDPRAEKDYKVSWTEYLQTAETVTESAWVITPVTASPLQAMTGGQAPSITDAGKSATVWLSGGLAGTAYRVTNQITTSAGRKDDRSLLIEIAEL